MKQNKDRKKNIYQKFHWKLTLFATVVTGCILVGATLLCLSLSERELERNQYISFLNNVNTTLSHMENQAVISHQWLSRLEASCQFMIQIYDNGTPLYYQQLHHSGGELSVMEKASALAREEHGMDIFTAPSSDKLLHHVEYAMEDAGVTYYASAATLPMEKGYLGILLLHSTENLQKDMQKQRLIFLLADLGAVAVLFLFFWFFTGRLIRPLMESRARQTRFISAASHELRAPLAVIMSALSALETASGNDRQRFIAMMQSEGKRMSRLIEDMLFLAGSDARSWRFSMEETELDTLILDVFEKYETAAAKTKRQLTVRLPEQELPPCLCDPQRITQVLSILIDNALSYTPEDSRITLSLSASEHRFLLKVSDNGPGIPDENKEKVFERFYRAEDSRTGKEHFGLGLCIAREIVEAHGGRIQVTDNVPQGAVFSIMLPDT